jgi:Mn-dependent DtxR family transcriptional regulator
MTIAEETGYVTRNLVMERLGLSKGQAYQRLSRMTERGSLILVGRRYFLPQHTAPAARHAEIILSYLAQESAVRQDIARLLHILPRQVYPIMRKLIASGDVVLEDGRYCLNPEKQDKNASLV